MPFELFCSFCLQLLALRQELESFHPRLASESACCVFSPSPCTFSALDSLENHPDFTIVALTKHGSQSSARSWTRILVKRTFQWPGIGNKSGPERSVSPSDIHRGGVL
eukprot:2240760-Rhodomonas_salina.3